MFSQLTFDKMLIGIDIGLVSKECSKDMKIHAFQMIYGWNMERIVKRPDHLIFF